MAELIGKYVQIGPYRTFYDQAGTEGIPVVCIPSAGASSSEYRHFLPYISEKGFQAYALDMPGHGKSYPNMADLSVLRTEQDFIDFIWDFIQAIGLDRPVVIGCAMSGSAVLMLASQHSEGLRGIVSAGGNSKFFLSKDYVDLLNHPSINTADYQEVTTSALCGRPLSVERLNECRWHNARSALPECIEADLRIYSRHNVKNVLYQITVPVLHLVGEYDATVSEESVRDIKELIPVVRQHFFEGAGHYSMIERPDEYNQIVFDFLEAYCRW